LTYPWRQPFHPSWPAFDGNDGWRVVLFGAWYKFRAEAPWTSNAYRTDPDTNYQPEKEVLRRSAIARPAREKYPHRVGTRHSNRPTAWPRGRYRQRKRAWYAPLAPRQRCRSTPSAASEVTQAGLPLNPAQKQEIHQAYGLLEAMLARVNTPLPREAEPALIFVPEVR
jgi:hypothetical protein